MLQNVDVFFVKIVINYSLVLIVIKYIKILYVNNLIMYFILFVSKIRNNKINNK